ncbi:hypothetical protein TVAG_340510 [Trichomonas vaginalis G3]|uniref:Aminoacyl-transfer RNA synthetases class-II family profile domain-containing protein n=1 Tax=Trichomonas vaginalis (strain ATCC PRA-98 / G3) TaxID=412133 RepID=A2EKG5_TRIV3|nr:aspartate-ammonia ligase family [Trichomonas vaginalis G3]EAY06873.1 hypothetical protein TVAG_340510 [Trichomonas vaginalis G3]KAI5489183.1 aspartate-ammonia ligase family [Trichomonas vaginalis G3]|eukprot:XP_001319096.1 hypothetical protein [Trichomonas vaginalis G3]
MPPQQQYKSTLEEIEYIKYAFPRLLKERLGFIRVSSPIFLEKSSGLNDDLNGVEEKVSFTHKGKVMEVVQSLAKWKRVALKKYNIKALYADMNAIRKDENVDKTHSMYVDQWDWEMVEEQGPEHVVEVVNTIHSCIYDLETELLKFMYPNISDEELENKKIIPKTITFITSEALRKKYPNISARERENKIAKLHKAVFIQQIGKELGDGSIHDSRAPDYDDWDNNGDIIYWSDALNESLEISSMGYRVNKDTLVPQLQKVHAVDRLENPYCKMIMNDELPQTIGGGIGQSRLCMLLMQRKHISEVQSGYWDDPVADAL